MIQIKPTPTLSLVVLLTGWIHFASSPPSSSAQNLYINFLRRLEQVIDASAADVLPFSLKAHVIKDWLRTSMVFKDLCLRYELELRDDDTYTPAMALNKTINRIFHHYIHSANTNFLVLESIRSGDPVGFIAYLTQNNLEISSPHFMRYATKFQAIMKQSLRLFNMKTNDSCFDILDESSSSAPNNFLPQTISIPPVVRNEIATEYGPLSDDSMDSVIDLLSEKMSITMYGVRTDVDNYGEHYSAEVHDVQILRGTMLQKEVNGTIEYFSSHPICVFYNSTNSRAYVYGRLKRVKLDDRQEAIIHKLYPFNKYIVLDMKTAFRDKHPSGGIFAIMYATILLMGESLATNPIKLNEAWGDETLYMRIHILNMLANRKVALLN